MPSPRSRSIGPAAAPPNSSAAANGVPSGAAPAVATPKPERPVRGWTHWIGSIQAALVLLPLFALALFLGTLIESWHDRKTAHQLIYRAWWFALLLGLLGANVVCAAVKKWPWKKHQTGFLITHLGLITLVASGLLTAFVGESGVLVMVDAPLPEYRRFGLHDTDFVIDRDRHTLRVLKNSAEVLRAEFDPGPLTWGAGEHEGPQLDLLTHALGWLRHPWPEGWSRQIAAETRLEALEFHPHTRELPFAPSSPAAREAFPALEFQLGSPTTGLLAPQWVGYHDSRRAVPVGVGLVEFLARNLSPEQLAEFANPPTIGKHPKGVLVIGLGGAVHRIDVATALEQLAQPLGDSGWRCSLLQYLPNFKDARDAKPTDPAVAFELIHEEAKTVGYALTARRGGELFPLPNQPPGARGPAEMWAWYHPPEPRWGDESLRAVLQFATGADGRWHYRTFSSGGERFAFEKAGLLPHGAAWERIWSGMQFKLHVTKLCPQAGPGPFFQPLPHKPPREEEAQPALRCRLTHRGEVADFWLGKTDGGLTRVDLAGDQFQVGFNATLRPLGFGLTLLKAEQTTDPGANLPASQSSRVRLRDAANNSDAEHLITLNEPLAHRGVKIYQTGHAAVGPDDGGRAVNRALLTVTHDPGLFFKYAGSAMVALGIACMFYMRAYFFKRPV